MRTGKIYYGWFLAVVFGLMFFMANGSLGSLAAIANPLMAADLGMSATAVSTGFSVLILMYGIGAPICGWLVSRLGTRNCQIVSGAALCLCGVSMAVFVTEPILYTITCAIVAVAALGVGQIAVQSTIGNWFIKRRGIAMTVVMTVGGLGGFGAPLIANALINWGGTWRSAWYFFIATGILAIIFALLFVKNKPQDIGLLPDGDVTSLADVAKDGTNGSAPAKSSVAENSAKPAKPTRVYKCQEEISYGQAVKTPAFWLIVLAGFGGFLFYSLATGISTFTFTEAGITRDVIVGGVSAMGFAMLIGKFAWGAISDFIEPARLLSFCSILIIIAIIIGIIMPSNITVYAYYVLAGFAYGGIATNLATTVANYFGSRDNAKNLGTTMLICGITSSFVPIIGGVMFDTTGTYVPLFYGVAACLVISVVCGLILRFPKKG